MRIKIKGTHTQKEELKKRISSDHELIEVKNNQFDDCDMIIDLSFDEDWQNLNNYSTLENKVIVVGATRRQLEKVVADFDEKIHCNLFGINSLPTFVNRDLAEMTSLSKEERSSIEPLFEALNWPIKWVESRVGMVSPRVVCMIINEAYYTVQEGTASKEDIDIGMKLGTAYPMGPFEWKEKIGIWNVYTLLEAIYEDTKDERYKICPLLKTEYLSNFK